MNNDKAKTLYKITQIGEQIIKYNKNNNKNEKALRKKSQ